MTRWEGNVVLCDACGELSVGFATLREAKRAGWSTLSGDGHLCATCTRKVIREHYL